MTRYAQSIASTNPRFLRPSRWPLNRRGTAALVVALLLALFALWRIA